jgi:hypothetical protein
MEKYKASEQSDRILVAMSPCLSSSHIVFQSPIQIKLPLINIPDTFEQDEICESLVFRWNTDGAFEVTDVVPEVVNGIGHFKVKSFSRYKILLVGKDMDVIEHDILFNFTLHTNESKCIPLSLMLYISQSHLIGTDCSN